MYVLAYVIFFVYLCSRKGLETSRHVTDVKKEPRSDLTDRVKKAGVASRRNTRRKTIISNKSSIELWQIR